MHTHPHNSLIFIALQIVIIVLRCPDVSLLLTMAFIATLPSELLLQIYQNLSTIDDVYALGHCSKSLYSIIISNGNLIRIMTSIIVRTSCPRIVALIRSGAHTCRCVHQHTLATFHCAVSSIPHGNWKLCQRGTCLIIPNQRPFSVHHSTQPRRI